MGELGELTGFVGNIILLVWLWRKVKQLWPETFCYRIWKKLNAKK